MIIQPSTQNAYYWQPPTDWIQLEAPSNNEILLLVSDLNPYYTFKVTVTGGYTVDWGDSTSNNYASAALASHTYTIGGGQSCSRGYTTFKIRIYAQTPANSITRFQIDTSESIKAIFNAILWARFGTTGLTSMANAFYYSTAPRINYSRLLERVDLPQILSSCTSYNNAFRNCTSLKEIQMPFSYSTANIDFGTAFSACYNLLRINYNVSSINVSTFLGAHQQNYNLIEAYLPSVINNCSSFQSTFESCYNLRPIELPIINTNCDCSSMFTLNYKLRIFTFNSSWDGKITTLYNMFYNCNNLQGVIFPSLSSLASNGLRLTFSGCADLQFVIFPTDLPNNLTDITSLFYGCEKLKSVSNFPALNSVTVYTNAFYNNNSLVDISNLNQLGDLTSGMDLINAFVRCYSFQSLSIRNKITGKFVLTGYAAGNLAALSSLLFINTGNVSTWAGSSPQVDVAYCSMDATALNALFTSIIATSSSFSGKTVRVTGNPGAATCNTSIITAAGGTVNKTT